MKLRTSLAIAAAGVAAGGALATPASAHHCRCTYGHAYRSSYRHVVVRRVAYHHRRHHHHLRYAYGYGYGYGYGYAPYYSVDYYDAPYAYDVGPYYGWSTTYVAAPAYYYEPAPLVIGYSGYGGGRRYAYWGGGRGHWDHGRHGGDGPHWHGH